MSIRLFNVIGNFSIWITLVCLMIVISWAIFRKKSTKNIKGHSMNNGTQKAWLMAIIGAIIPISISIASVSKIFMSALVESQKLELPLAVALPWSKIVVNYLGITSISSMISIVIYVFIRCYGAHSGCKRDIRFMKRF